MICIQKIYGFHGLNHQIIEKAEMSRLLRTDERTDGRWKTRKSKHCGFCIYIFDYSFDQSKSMVTLVRAEKMVLSGQVFARKIARMILIQNI